MTSLYETFVQVVERETLSEAASHLHLTQPTVTRQLQQLERDCGVALFDRVGRRMVLNRAGTRVYQTARQVIALQHKLEDELREFADPESGTVYIGAGLTPSIYLLPPVLAAYRELHPRVQFQVQSGSSKQVLELLRTHEVDMGVVTTADPRADLVLMPILPDQLLLVAAPNHPLLTTLAQHPPAISFAELSAWPLVLMRPESGLRAIIASLAETSGVVLRIAMETDSLESINRLVQNGVGLAVLPRSSVQDDLASGRLVEVAVADVRLPSRTITLATVAGSTLPASAARFAAALPALCAGFVQGGVVQSQLRQAENGGE